MIYFANDVDTLISALDSMKAVGVKHIGMPVAKGRLTELLQLELVYVNKSGVVVGDEANDYRPKEGEVAAVMIS